MFFISLLTDLSVAARLCVMPASADEVSMDALLPAATGADVAVDIAAPTVEDPGNADGAAAVTGEVGAAAFAGGAVAGVVFGVYPNSNILYFSGFFLILASASLASKFLLSPGP